MKCLIFISMFISASVSAQVMRASRIYVERTNPNWIKIDNKLVCPQISFENAQKYLSIVVAAQTENSNVEFDPKTCEIKQVPGLHG